MLPKPSILKVPNASHSVGGYIDPACGGYSAAGCAKKVFSCAPYGTNGAGCIDATYSKPKDDGGCSWTLGIGIGGIVVTAGVGAVAASPT